MSDAGGLFGVPKEEIPADLYDALVQAKTRDWQKPGPGHLSPKQRRRAWTVTKICIIRSWTIEQAQDYYDQVVVHWLEY